MTHLGKQYLWGEGKESFPWPFMVSETNGWVNKGIWQNNLGSFKTNFSLSIPGPILELFGMCMWACVSVKNFKVLP